MSNRTYPRTVWVLRSLGPMKPSARPIFADDWTALGYRVCHRICAVGLAVALVLIAAGVL